MNKYYQPSGSFSPLSFIYLLLVACTLIPLSALLYAYAIWYIPFIYLNFIIAAAFGFAVGFILDRFAIGMGKVRNPLIASMYGLFAGVVAVYCHWAVWIDLVINAGESYGTDRIGVTVSNISPAEMFALLLQPAKLFSLIKIVNETGTWGIRGLTPSGAFLGIIWFVEAAIIVVIPVFLARARSKKPFSERYNSWASEKVLPAFEYIEDSQQFKTSLEQPGSGIIETLKVCENPHEEMHSVLTLYYAEQDEFYLSVTNKIPKKDDKDKITFSEDDFIQYLSIDTKTGNILREG